MRLWPALALIWHLYYWTTNGGFLVSKVTSQTGSTSPSRHILNSTNLSTVVSTKWMSNLKVLHFSINQTLALASHQYVCVLGTHFAYVDLYSNQTDCSYLCSVRHKFGTNWFMLLAMSRKMKFLYCHYVVDVVVRSELLFWYPKPYSVKPFHHQVLFAASVNDAPFH